MKGRSLILAAVLILAIGIILIITRLSITTFGIVVVGGILFVLSGLLNIFAYLAERPRPAQVKAAREAGFEVKGRSGFASLMAWASSGAAVILGACMLIFTSTFLQLVPFVFALLITFGALYQFYLLAYGSRPTKLPGWLFVVPVLLIGAAIYVFLQNAGHEVDDRLIMLITGISATLFGATLLTESIMIGAANHRREHPRTEPKAASTPDTTTQSDSHVEDVTDQVKEVKALKD